MTTCDVNAIFFIGGALVVIWFGYKFIQNKDVQEESMKTKYKTYYRIGKLYFIFIILMFLTYSVYSTYSCIISNPITSTLIRNVASTFYGMEHNILIFLLFYRLQLAFDDSTFQLKPCNIWLYYIVYAIYIITVIVLNALVFTGDLYTPFGAMMIFITWVLQFVLIVWVTIIFTYKLRVISFNPHSESEEDAFSAQMMFITTKMTLLTIFAIIPNFMGVAVRVYAGAVQQSPAIDFLGLLSIVFDVASNFVAILLGFKSYETQYMKTCGCCHHICVRCCARGKPAVKQVALTIQQKQAPKEETTNDIVLPADPETYTSLATQTQTSGTSTFTARVGPAMV
eukprot:255470_1